MAKKVEAYIKLQVPAQDANPSPPVGPALGQHGVNIMEFCKAFNAQTSLRRRRRLRSCFARLPVSRRAPVRRTRTRLAR